jgi:hypothetical protein
MKPGPAITVAALYLGMALAVPIEPVKKKWALAPAAKGLSVNKKPELVNQLRLRI